ncbi:hypothetical protein ACKKBF_B40965 [Auxenochlorella protothecoides x Auxenochlorella symbiontica]
MVILPLSSFQESSEHPRTEPIDLTRLREARASGWEGVGYRIRAGWHRTVPESWDSQRGKDDTERQRARLLTTRGATQHSWRTGHMDRH